MQPADHGRDRSRELPHRGPERLDDSRQLVVTGSVAGAPPLFRIRRVPVPFCALWTRCVLRAPFRARRICRFPRVLPALFPRALSAVFPWMLPAACPRVLPTVLPRALLTLFLRTFPAVFLRALPAAGILRAGRPGNRRIPGGGRPDDPLLLHPSLDLDAGHVAHAIPREVPGASKCGEIGVHLLGAVLTPQRPPEHAVERARIIEKAPLVISGEREKDEGVPRGQVKGHCPGVLKDGRDDAPGLGHHWFSSIGSTAVERVAWTATDPGRPAVRCPHDPPDRVVPRAGR